MMASSTFLMASFLNSYIGICEPVITIPFFQSLQKNESKDAVYANVSVPCITTNVSYL